MKHWMSWVVWGVGLLLTACGWTMPAAPALEGTATWTPLAPAAPTATVLSSTTAPQHTRLPSPTARPDGRDLASPSPAASPLAPTVTAFVPPTGTATAPPSPTFTPTSAGLPGATPWPSPQATATAPPPTREMLPSPTLEPPSATPVPPTVAVSPTVTATPAPPSATPTATMALPTPSATAPLASCAVNGNATYEAQLLALINQERQAQGLSPLAMEPHLQEAARAHSEDMACNGFFAHTGSDGSTFADRVLHFGYAFSYVGENIYAGSGPYNSPEAVFNAWLNSPPHRENMLNPNFIHVGIGYCYAPESPYGSYWTADFGRP